MRLTNWYYILTGQNTGVMRKDVLNSRCALSTRIREMTWEKNEFRQGNRSTPEAIDCSLIKILWFILVETASAFRPFSRLSFHPGNGSP
jgi:hypothetical protein